MRRGGCIPSSAARCTRKLQLAPYTTLGWRSWWRTGSWSRATPPERGRPGRGPTCWYSCAAGTTSCGGFTAQASVCGATSQRTTSSSTLRHWISECGALYTSAGTRRKGASKITAPSHGRWGRSSRCVRPSLPTLRTGWTWLMKAGLAMSTSSGTTSHLWNQDKHWVHWWASLRRRLEELRGSDPRVYRLVMQLLAPYDNWQFIRCRNGLMNATRRHTERRLRHRGQRGAAFHPTARGMLTVIRHCSQHAGRRHEDLMVLIIEDDFRRFAGHFQRVMYNMSQLRFLNLEVSMG